jgi:protein SCO1/2
MKRTGWIRNTLIGIVLIGIFAAGLWLGIKRETRQQAQLIQLDPNITLLGEPRSLKAFRLANHRGEPFTDESLHGVWTLLFFGYTYCPDICPTTLVTLQSVKTRLEAMGDAVQPVQVVFVSVDPKRDTPERLARYVTHYHKDFVGVTGAPDEIARLASGVGAAYEFAFGNDPDNYLVNHSASVYLVDPQARFHALFTPPLFPDRITTRLDMIQKR